LGLPVEREIDLPGGEKLTLMLIPPGEFLMGSTTEEQARVMEEAKAAKAQFAIGKIPGEGPQHRVRITKPFALSRHEVTRGQFRQFVKETGYKTEAERDGKGGYGFADGKFVQDPRFIWSADPGFPQTDDHPVVNVSWNDGTAFCQWLSKKQGTGYDLPTEAQWEYACRAGTTTARHFGDSDTMLQEYAWSATNSGGKTHAVAQLKPNTWGLYDMHGNVWEWCADWYGADYYAQSPPRDPSGPTTGSFRVYRGGGWYRYAGNCRSASRPAYSPDYRSANLGFRLACEIPTASPGGRTGSASIAKRPAIKPVPAGPSDAATLLSRWTFSEPVNLGPTINSEENEVNPSLSADGLTLLFASDRPGGLGGRDLWQCTRASTEEPFGAPINLGSPVNSVRSEGSATLSADGRTLTFSTEKSRGGAQIFWMCEREEVGGVFGKPRELGPAINAKGGCLGPDISSDGLSLVFESTRPGGQGRFDLWISTRESPRDAFRAPTNLGPTVNTAENDGGPMMSSDQLALFFHSSRSGGHGADDLWISTRSAVNEVWSAPVNLGPSLNSGKLESHPTLSSDGRTLIFASNRPNGQGALDLWMTRIEQRGGPTAPRAVAGLRKGGDNYALLFDGKPDCVEIPTLKYDGSHPITIEATVRLDSDDPTSAVVSNVARNRRPQAGARLFSFSPTKHWGIGIQRGGTWYHLDWDHLDRDRWPKPEIGQTIRLAGVWDGKEVRLFTNGQRIQTGTVPQPRAGDAEIASLFIGADPGDTGGTAGHFIGVIDEMRISTIARYDKDFRPPERFEADEHTLALYHFDEGRGDVLNDSSGNGHHGKIIEAKWVQVKSGE